MGDCQRICSDDGIPLAERRETDQEDMDVFRRHEGEKPFQRIDVSKD